jgi:MGT family glycosyltransferase
MSRIVYFNVPAHGHVNPTLPVASELVRRGHEVTYFNYASDDFRGPLERTGAEVRMLSGLNYDPARPDPTLLHPGPHLTAFLLEAAWVFLPTLLSELQRLQPDLIVHDTLCPWGRFAARILGIRSVCTSVMFAFRKDVLPAMRLHKLAWTALRGAGALTRHFWTAAKLRRKYRLDGLDLVSVLTNRGDLNVVFTSREFQPHADRFDNSYRFVGPSFAPRAAATDFPLDQLSGRRAIYISLGTLHTQSERFYRTCIEAFGGWDNPVVMTVGKHTELASLGTIPGNFIVRPFVPQLEVLRRAALFISHAGMNSVQESLCHGVPLLMVPQTDEQAMVANRAASFSTGLVLRCRDLKVDRLRQKARLVLDDPRFRLQAAAVGESLRGAGGYLRAADEIVRFQSGGLPGPVRRAAVQRV